MFMKGLFLLFALAVLPGLLSAKLVKADLSEAIKNRSVSLEAVNTEGRYKGKTTKLRITNTEKFVQQITVNLGVILKPDDTGAQPMVLAGGEDIIIPAGDSREIMVMTFCGNSPRSCPSKNSRYSYWRVGSDTLVKVLEFIKANSIYNIMGQDAVWVITNHHSVSNVYQEDNPEMVKKFVDLLCKLTGQPQPDFHTVMPEHEVAGQPAYVPKALKIIATFEVRLDSPKTLTLGVFNDAGEMIQKVFIDQEFGRSGHRFEVEFESADVAPGHYYIRLKEHDTVLQQKMVMVE